MLGRLDESRKEVLILGAGFSGLLSAWHLARLGWKVDLVEGTDRVGGLISTNHGALGLAEAAAHSFLATPAVLSLCRELGVTLVPVREKSRARYILRDGKPRRFPLKWFETIDLLSKVFFRRADAKHSAENADLTLDIWSDFFLGKPALEYLLNPMVRGVYASRPSELEISTAFSGLAVQEGAGILSLLSQRRKKQASGSHARMMAPLLGMNSVISALERELRAHPRVTIRTGMKVTSLEGMDVPNLISTLPAYSLSRIFAVDSRLEEASACARVNYAPLISVTAFVRQEGFKKPIRGVGTLVPEIEGKEGWYCLGVLYNSSSFEGRVQDEEAVASFSLMFGGTSHPEHFSWDDEQLRQKVISTLERMFGLIRGEDALIDIKIHRWGQAIPIHDGDLRRAREALLKGFCSSPGRMVFGNWTGEVSLRGMIEFWDSNSKLLPNESRSAVQKAFPLVESNRV
jgi:oxygen-dependent protoporphyrinogen oxidase